MKAIKDQSGVGQSPGDGVDVGRTHVRGHGLDLSPTASQPLPEGFQGVCSLAPADVDDGPAFQVQDNRQVAVAVADGDFVDGNLSQLLQLGSAEAAAQILLVNLLDEVPTDSQVVGDVLDGHAATQFQGIAGKSLGVAAAWVGKVEGN